MTNRKHQKSTWRDRLPRLVAEHADLLQKRLLDLSAFSSLTHDLGLSFRSQDNIALLWRLRLLRADLVVSSKRLRTRGLEYLGRSKYGEYEYADARRLRRRSKGWIDAASSAPAIPRHANLYFHPFRFYVIQGLDRTFDMMSSPTRLLTGCHGMDKLHRWEIEVFTKLSAQREFTVVREYWNDIATLAVATEPCMYERAFGRVRYSVRDGLHGHRHRVAEHWKQTRDCFQEIGLDEIQRIHQALCLSAETLDPNKELHQMLRLAGRGEYERLRGNIGGAMLLLTMAEIIRRGGETVFRLRMKEEDEGGFGWTPPGTKRRLFGTDRLVDGDRKARAEFARKLGLDFGIRLRWYVEGDTEYQAILGAFGEGGSVEVVNLAGTVLERRGRYAALRDAFRRDMQAGWFSYVSIDGDRPDVVRVVRQAVAADEICGRIFISTPDFEFHNFTIRDFERILWGIAHERGARPSARDLLRSRIHGATNAKDLISRARRALPELSDLSKGRAWGKKLIEYAFAHSSIEKGRTRPIIDAVRSAMIAVTASHHYQMQNFRVDPESGDFVSRPEGASRGITASPA